MRGRREKRSGTDRHPQTPRQKRIGDQQSPVAAGETRQHVAAGKERWEFVGESVLDRVADSDFRAQSIAGRLPAGFGIDDVLRAVPRHSQLPVRRRFAEFIPTESRQASAVARGTRRGRSQRPLSEIPEAAQRRHSRLPPGV